MVLQRDAQMTTPNVCASCGRSGTKTYATAKPTRFGFTAVCGDCLILYQSYGEAKGAGTGRLSDKTNSFAIVEPKRVRIYTTISRRNLNPSKSKIETEIISSNGMNKYKVVREVMLAPPPKFSMIFFQSSALNATDLVMNIDPNLVAFSGNKGLDGFGSVNAKVVRNYLRLFDGKFSDADLKAYIEAKTNNKRPKIVDRVEALYPFLDDFAHPEVTSAEVTIAARCLKKDK